MRRKRSAAAPSSIEFFLPRDVFKLELKQGLLLAYICLQYQKGVQSSQCWPGYATIGAAVGMPRKTVQRHVCALVDKGLAVTENTSVFSHGLKINGNLRCTLKPILQVLKERRQVLFQQTDRACPVVPAEGVPRHSQRRHPGGAPYGAHHI